MGEVAWPDKLSTGTVRVDTWVIPGSTISPSFDSLIAKLMVHAESRDVALAAMREALAATRLKGLPTNAQLHTQVLDMPPFMEGLYTTHVLNGLHWSPSYVEARCS